MSALFYYTARDGEGSFVRGAIEAATAGSALASLRTRALFVSSLQPASSAEGALSAALFAFPVRAAALVMFFRSFATLIGAGVAMQRSLDVTIGQCSDRRLAEALRAVRADVENGLELSAALQRRPREFSGLFAAMVRAGEAQGALDEALDRVATLLERERALRKKVAASLTYPCVVAVTACVLIAFLLTTIVPQFAALYAQMHAQLPAITVALLHAADAAHDWQAWVVALAAMLVLVMVAGRTKTTPSGALALDSFRLRLPIAGPIARKAAVARFARVLGGLLRSGIDLVAALDLVREAVGSAVYAESVCAVRDALRAGDSLAISLGRSGLYEQVFVAMVRVGEETGALDTMLLRLASYYEGDLEAALATIGAVIEPLLIVVLGGAVGFIVASIFIPLYTLIGSIH